MLPWKVSIPVCNSKLTHFATNNMTYTIPVFIHMPPDLSRSQPIIITLSTPALTHAELVAQIFLHADLPEDWAIYPEMVAVRYRSGGTAKYAFDRLDEIDIAHIQDLEVEARDVQMYLWGAEMPGDFIRGIFNI
jgi:hypothetical protein